MLCLYQLPPPLCPIFALERSRGFHPQLGIGDISKACQPILPDRIDHFRLRLLHTAYLGIDIQLVSLDGQYRL